MTGLTPQDHFADGKTELNKREAKEQLLFEWGETYDETLRVIAEKHQNPQERNGDGLVKAYAESTEVDHYVFYDTEE